MKKKLLPFLFFMLALGCGNPAKKTAVSPVGTWQSHQPWDNNFITVTVRPDSSILFKAEKSFCPGTKYFISVGKWHIEKDSILVMKQYTDGRKYQIKDLFPELTKNASDSNNVIPLDMEAHFIFSRNHLYDIEPDGKPSSTRYYDPKK